MDARQYFNKINLFFQGLTAIVLVAFVLVWLYLEKTKEANNGILESHPQAQMIGLGVILINLILISWWQYRFVSKRNTLVIGVGWEEKLKSYMPIYKRHLYRYTALSLVNCAVYYLMSHEIYIASFAVALFLMTMNRPTINRLARQMRFDKDEKQQFFKSAGLI